MISRNHAEVCSGRTGRFLIRDLGSKNGTFVGARAVPAKDNLVLDEGQVIRIGNTLMMFHVVDFPRPGTAALEGFSGFSDTIRKVRAAVLRCAVADSPVLITGESGTGKELCAAALAREGRTDGPFVPFNSAAISSTLVEATLFGHIKGAFTDAKKAHDGLFRSAHRGTLFLDEVGELPPETQVKLLRVLEDNEVVPVGSTKGVPVDVRLVTATSRDLTSEVSEGRFRRALYSRLAYLGIEVPPLRERLEDVPLLALHFSNGRSFTADAMWRLLQHPWPLNVRELKATVEQMLVYAKGEVPLDISDTVKDRLARHARMAELGPALVKKGRVPTREEVEAALERHHGNMTRTAEELGKDRGQLYRLVKRMVLDPDGYR